MLLLRTIMCIETCNLQTSIPMTKLDTRCAVAFAERWQGKSGGKVNPTMIPFLPRSGLASNALKEEARCFSTPASKKKHLHRCRNGRRIATEGILET